MNENGRNKKTTILLVIAACIVLCAVIPVFRDMGKLPELPDEPETEAPQTTISIEIQTEEPETTAETVETEPEPEIPEVWTEAEVEDDPYMKELAEIDLRPFREGNQDVLGWITIPGTQVDYPLMEGEDNEFYLSHTWDKKASEAGSILLEYRSNPDFRDFNTLIYGHRMKNGTMFGSLKHYDTEEYYREHPYVYLVDDLGVHRYEIFAAYTAAVNTRTYYYGFTDEETMQLFLDYCMEMSVIDTGVIPTPDDKVLTLVTCTGNGYDARWVVQARLKGVENNPRRLYDRTTKQMYESNKRLSEDP